MHKKELKPSNSKVGDAFRNYKYDIEHTKTNRISYVTLSRMEIMILNDNDLDHNLVVQHHMKKR